MEINIKNLTFFYPGAKAPVFEEFDFKAMSGIPSFKVFRVVGKARYYV